MSIISNIRLRPTQHIEVNFDSINQSSLVLVIIYENIIFTNSCICPSTRFPCDEAHRTMTEKLLNISNSEGLVAIILVTEARHFTQIDFPQNRLQFLLVVILSGGGGGGKANKLSFTE